MFGNLFGGQKQQQKHYQGGSFYGSSRNLSNGDNQSIAADSYATGTQSQTSAQTGLSDVSVVSPLRQLLDAVNMSILPHDLRLSSISQACGFFDHRDRMTHDSELREGAAFILYQKLSFALSLSNNYGYESDMPSSILNTKTPGSDVLSHRFRSSVDSSDADHEIALLCSCLEMVHRASPDAIAATWYDIGEDILPLLVRVMERPFIKLAQRLASARTIQAKRNNGNGKGSGGISGVGSNGSGLYFTGNNGAFDITPATQVNRDLKLAVQKVTKLLAMYSLVPEAKYPMAHCPGMLPVLVKIIDTRHLNRVRPHGPGGVHHAAAGSGRDGANGNSELGLNGVRGSSSGVGLVMTEAARFNTIATLTNLAAAEENRITMLAESSLVDNIARIVQNERSDVARQCSALALMNLSNGDKDHVPEMATELLLETLITLMKDDMPETRRNAAVALFNVACADENTIRVAKFRDGIILDALIEVITNDDQDESRSNAAETLFNMSCSDAIETTNLMSNHPGLLESLALVLTTSHNAKIDVKMYCAATLRRMAEIIKYPMKSQIPLLAALVKASTWTRTSDIAEAMEAHAEHEENRKSMAEYHGLLNALGKLALTTLEQGGKEHAKVQRAAVSAIERLARDEVARPLLAHNEGIMMALTRASYGPNVDTNINPADIDFDDDQSITSQGRMVQTALKNLVAAM